GARPRRRLQLRVQPWDLVLLPAVHAALRMNPELRRVVVRTLLEELCAMRSGPTAAPSAAATPAAPAHREAAAVDAEAGTSAAAFSRLAAVFGAPAAGFTRWS